MLPRNCARKPSEEGLSVNPWLAVVRSSESARRAARQCNSYNIPSPDAGRSRLLGCSCRLTPTPSNASAGAWSFSLPPVAAHFKRHLNLPAATRAWSWWPPPAAPPGSTGSVERGEDDATPTSAAGPASAFACAAVRCVASACDHGGRCTLPSKAATRSCLPLLPRIQPPTSAARPQSASPHPALGRACWRAVSPGAGKKRGRRLTLGPLPTSLWAARRESQVWRSARGESEGQRLAAGAATGRQTKRKDAVEVRFDFAKI
ncbi:hypothetical protein PVAP13_2KG203261 [Panicum virgatum]|uniref:Uncharacterized protein n=1 Tax=Panicum virgatum TaxID=38727 RepID=A0A8T0WE55_PANVG|nr:hypothetical protein PVAP13_2KG203261 [Panicum virgatum]